MVKSQQDTVMNTTQSADTHNTHNDNTAEPFTPQPTPHTPQPVRDGRNPTPPPTPLSTVSPDGRDPSINKSPPTKTPTKAPTPFTPDIDGFDGNHPTVAPTMSPTSFPSQNPSTEPTVTAESPSTPPTLGPTVPKNDPESLPSSEPTFEPTKMKMMKMKQMTNHNHSSNSFIRVFQQYNLLWYTFGILTFVLCCITCLFIFYMKRVKKYNLNQMRSASLNHLNLSPVPSTSHYASEDHLVSPSPMSVAVPSTPHVISSKKLIIHPNQSNQNQHLQIINIKQERENNQPNIVNLKMKTIDSMDVDEISVSSDTMEQNENENEHDNDMNDGMNNGQQSISVVHQINVNEYPWSDDENNPIQRDDKFPVHLLSPMVNGRNNKHKKGHLKVLSIASVPSIPESVDLRKHFNSVNNDVHDDHDEDEEKANIHSNHQDDGGEFDVSMVQDNISDNATFGNV